jgi:Protein of unknown function (DUF551)
MQIEITPEGNFICGWFAKCTNTTNKVTKLLKEYVPVCERCATRLKLETFEATFDVVKVPTMSEWIACKDRLPEVFEDNAVFDRLSDVVLVYGSATSPRDTTQCVAYCYQDISNDTKEYYWRTACSEGWEITPTHWQPLPKPPVTNVTAQ